LDQTIQVAGWFLPENDVVLIEKDRHDQKAVHFAKGPALLANIPTVVLVNEGTASAAEILAGALRDNRQIDIIGTKTFGKGLVQKVMDLDDGSALKVTVTKWYTPKEEIIQGIGIKPSIEVLLTEEDHENNNDTQLKEALKQINKIIIK